MKIDVAPEQLRKALARVSESYSDAYIIACKFTPEYPEGVAVCVGYGDEVILDVLIAQQGDRAKKRLALRGIFLSPDSAEEPEGESPLP